MAPRLSTYRLQVRGRLRLPQARALVPYLERLGVTHVYSSPLLRARAGSAHGYDVVDPTVLDPQLGGPEDLAALASTLRERDMGLLLDIVPNHVATSAENPFWDDVLAHGRASRYATWFDVDWDAGEGRTRGKLLLPVLGDRFATVLERGEIRVTLEDGVPRVRYHEHGFPLDPATLPLVLGHGAAPAATSAPAGAAPPPRAATLEAALAELRALPSREPPAEPDASRLHAAERDRAARAALAGLRRAQEDDPAARAAVHAALGRLEGPGGIPLLRRILDRQAYALVHWRRARGELNYRRFFDVNELAAVRVELPEVFAATHARILEWLRDGGVDALRVDHVDGLLDPLGYLQRLRAAGAAELGGAPPGILVEKILGPGEELPEWPVDGTTGYEFLNQLEAVFLHPGGAAEVETGYRRLTGRERGFAAAARRGKREALTGLLATDVQRLALRLRRIARRRGPPPRLTALADAIVEAIVHLPVYRTYVDGRPGTPVPADRERLESALAGARAGGRADDAALDLLEEVLLPPPGVGAADAAQRLAFALRFQQTSGPAAAKGVEDTALYVHVPLLSRNEVGGDPEGPLDRAVERLHAANAERARRWPATLLATTTHDTKRSADVRARLDVLSELPREWLAAVGRWRRWNRQHRLLAGTRRLPDANTEYLLYQTLLGVWPLSTAGAPPPDAEERAALRERLQAYALKAAREAKVHTSWIEPDERFEGALARFIDGLLPDAGPSPFLDDLAALAGHVTRPGLWNALSRTLVHLTAPGVPDLYQGDELWSFTLVDPDNRRPVDFELRARALEALERGLAPGGDAARRVARDLACAPEDGLVKLLVVRGALHERRRRPELFTRGGYTPLDAVGERAPHLVAFARTAPDAATVVVVPRWTATLPGGGAEAPLGRPVWGDAYVPLPAALRGRTWRSALTGATVEERGGAILAADALADLPVALLLSPGGAGPEVRRRGR